MFHHILVLLCFMIIISTAIEQAVTVKGIINCRGHRQPGTFVQLYDEDSFTVFDSDDLLGSVIADHRGVFCVKGFTDEFTTIEPYILIEHNCGYEGLNEKRTFTRIVPEEYITEGTKAKRVYHVGDIELLTEDAPVQKYEKRIYVETSMDERIRQCIPIYVQYKRFYEKTVIESNLKDTGVVLPVDVEEPQIEVLSTTSDSLVPMDGDERAIDEKDEAADSIELETVRIDEERKRLEEEKLRIEENQRLDEEQLQLDEIRRLEEEKLRLEEIRRIEEEKLRIEEIRRQEEEQKRLEMERREEERRLEEEKRAEEIRLQEQRRKEQEEEHKRRLEEYHKREQERQETLKRREEEIRRREEEERTRLAAVAKETKPDPCVQFPIASISRSVEMRHEYIEDPCLRK